MNVRFATALVLAAATVVAGQTPGAARPQDESVADPDAYAVYAAVLPMAWAAVSKDTLLLQRETEDIAAVAKCLSSSPLAAADPEWGGVAANFKQANASVRVLERTLPVDIPYRLIPRADIVADDARLAQKYPGVWERRPESMEYAAVSAVGFNPAKDKALVYVRLRSSGELYARELRERRWVVAKRNVCGWIA